MERKQERRLIRAAVNGDQDAYAQLYAANLKYVQNQFYRYNIPAGAIEDLTQQVFIKAFRNLGTFRGECAFSTWLFKVAKWEFSMYLRAKRPDSDSIEEMAENGFDIASRRRIPVDRMIDFERALGSLPEYLRNVVEEIYIGGKMFKEYAKERGTEISTVKSYGVRARARIVAEMNKRRKVHENSFA